MLFLKSDIPIVVRNQNFYFTNKYDKGFSSSPNFSLVLFFVILKVKSSSTFWHKNTQGKGIGEMIEQLESKPSLNPMLAEYTETHPHI